MSDIITYPLDGIDYDASDAAGYFATRQSGVYSADDCFSVSLAGGTSLTVSSGLAWVHPSRFTGYSIILRDPETVELPIADGTRPRIDRLVLRFDAQARKSSLVVLRGTAAGEPTAPAITRTALIYDLCLAEIRRAAGSLSITASDLTDTRLDEDLCGIMRDGVTGIPTADLLAQAKASIAGFEETASTSAQAAKQSEQNAAASKKDAADSASTATTKAGEAADSARQAASSASAAEQSKTDAAGSASTAAAKASEASTSAGLAAGSADAAEESRVKAEAAAKQAEAIANTDNTLTISGAPADAKTVGDKLSDRYTKSEVDQKIEDVHSETDATLTISGAPADAKATGDALAKKLTTDSSSYIRSVSISGNTITIMRGDGTGYQSQLAESYTLPAATYSRLGGVIVGTNLSITSSGVLSATDGASIVAQSIGADNSYIRLSNGIQICWGFASYRYVTFLAPFVNNNSVGFASHTDYAGTTSLVNSTKTTLSANFLNWIAIGLWK